MVYTYFYTIIGTIPANKVKCSSLVVNSLGCHCAGLQLELGEVHSTIHSFGFDKMSNNLTLELNTRGTVFGWPPYRDIFYKALQDLWLRQNSLAVKGKNPRFVVTPSLVCF